MIGKYNEGCIGYYREFEIYFNYKSSSGIGQDIDIYIFKAFKVPFITISTVFYRVLSSKDYTFEEIESKGKEKIMKMIDRELDFFEETLPIR